MPIYILTTTHFKCPYIEDTCMFYTCVRMCVCVCVYVFICMYCIVFHVYLFMCYISYMYGMCLYVMCMCVVACVYLHLNHKEAYKRVVPWTIQVAQLRACLIWIKKCHKKILFLVTRLKGSHLTSHSTQIKYPTISRQASYK